MAVFDYSRVDNELWLSIEVIDTALEERDSYTRNHSRRLLTLAAKTGELCGLDVSDIKLLQMAGNMHDLGKIGIPDSVLLKPERLESDEWEIIKTHCAKGERIIKKVPHESAKKVARIIRHHHEQFDGYGYPDALTGEEIPYCSRIISVCDSYDAMTTTRIYSLARSHQETLEIMFNEEGEKSDPYIFRRFLSVVGNGAGYSTSS
jgi:HD-GYP domain-containing protein (c-di-GMP phosphodiesterase class II)